MAYTLTSWANFPATTSELNATTLGRANTAITDLDARAGIDPGPPSGTNDRTALQAAATEARSAGNGVIRLRAGVYKTDRCIDIPSNTTLVGAGRGATTLQAISGIGSTTGTNGGYSILGQDPTADRNITIRDLTLDGNYAATGIGLASPNRENAGVVDFRFITGLQFLNVEVKNGWFYHLAAWDSTDVFVSGCHVTGPGTSGTYDQLDGIHLVGVNRGTVVGCHVDMGDGDDGDDGVVARVFPGGEPCSDIVITGNTIRSGPNGDGIDIANSDGDLGGLAITGNLIWGCVDAAIVTQWFSAFTGVTQNIVITGNTIRDCGASIVLGDESGNAAPYKNVLVSGNLCVRAGGLPSQRTPTTGATNISITGNLAGS